MPSEHSLNWRKNSPFSKIPGLYVWMGPYRCPYVGHLLGICHFFFRVLQISNGGGGGGAADLYKDTTVGLAKNKQIRQPGTSKIMFPFKSKNTNTAASSGCVLFPFNFLSISE